MLKRIKRYKLVIEVGSLTDDDLKKVERHTDIIGVGFTYEPIDGSSNFELQMGEFTSPETAMNLEKSLLDDLGIINNGDWAEVGS